MITMMPTEDGTVRVRLVREVVPGRCDHCVGDAYARTRRLCPRYELKEGGGRICAEANIDDGQGIWIEDTPEGTAGYVAALMGV